MDWKDALPVLLPESTGTPVDQLAGVRSAIAEFSGVEVPESHAGLITRSRRSINLEAPSFGGFEILSPDGIRAAWAHGRTMFEQDSEVVDRDVAGASDPRVRRYMFHPRRLPIATYNGDIWICLDFVPTKKGTAGQVIQIDPESLDWFWLAASLDDLLAELAQGRILDPDLGAAEDED